MITKDDLKTWVARALHDLGGEAVIVDVAKWIWDRHESDLRASGSMFYKWQYEMRWAAQALVKEGKLNKTSERGVWKLLL